MDKYNDTWTIRKLFWRVFVLDMGEKQSSVLFRLYFRKGQAFHRILKTPLRIYAEQRQAAEKE